MRRNEEITSSDHGQTRKGEFLRGLVLYISKVYHQIIFIEDYNLFKANVINFSSKLFIENISSLRDSLEISNFLSFL
jgi:hypothetical protein